MHNAPMNDDFHIDFQRSGGFTGRLNSVQLSSKELDPELVTELGLLIERSGFFEALVMENKFLNLPDQFSYQMTIEYMGKKRTLEVTDSSMPELFRPLVNCLVRLIRKQK